MQGEGAVGWDPISVNHHLSWQGKLFILYLLLSLLVSIVRSGSLVRQLWFGPSGRRADAESTLDQQEKAHFIARLALSNRFLKIDQSLATERQDKGNAFLVVLKRADIWFRYAWEVCTAKVTAIRRMALLALLLALLVLTDGVANVFVWIQQEKRWPAVVAGTLAELVTIVGLGAFFAALFYGLSIFYEGALARRRAAWKFFCANASEEIDASS